MSEKAKYRWIITKDKLADTAHKAPSNMNAVGMIGPRNADETVNDGEVEFRMSDDDGEVYYYGKLYGDYQGFEPLDDFGTPNSGCVRIEHKENGKWVMV